MDLAIAIGFLLFGLGYFTFVTHYVVKDEDKSYSRRLNEQREFGFRFEPPGRRKRRDRESHPEES